jgi:hypothetical protein
MACGVKRELAQRPYIREPREGGILSFHPKQHFTHQITHQIPHAYNSPIQSQYYNGRKQVFDLLPQPRYSILNVVAVAAFQWRATSEFHMLENGSFLTQPLIQANCV